MEETINTPERFQPTDYLATPRVSVVTIFLNEERYLEEAIESVFAQTYPHWELILVDDGSTDASSAIARAWTGRFPERVRYFEHREHRNRGKGPSRNLGLRQARGELIAFLDGDDLFLPEKLETQVELLKSHPEVNLLYGSSLFWHFGSTSMTLQPSDFVQNLGIRSGTVVPPPELLTMLLRNENYHPTNCSMLLRRQVGETVGWFDEDFGDMYEDSIFLAKCLLMNGTLISGDCTSVYRLHAESSCHREAAAGTYHPTEPNPSRRAYLERLSQYMNDIGVSDERLRGTLARELFPYWYPVLYRIARNTRSSARCLRTTIKHNFPLIYRNLKAVLSQPESPPPPGKQTATVAEAFLTLASLYRSTGRDAASEDALAAARRVEHPGFTDQACKDPSSGVH